MKRIVNSIAPWSLMVAAVSITVVFIPQLKVSPVIAASAPEANATAPFKAKAVRAESVVEVSAGRPSAKLDGPFNIGNALPDKNDTPESMMSVGKEGLGAAKEQAVALNEAAALMNRLSTDKAYATKLLEAIKKEDAGAVATVLKETITKSSITVGNIKSDFHVEVHVTVGSWNGSWCISNDHSCSGHNVVLG